jgi:chitodextrinase
MYVSYYFNFNFDITISNKQFVKPMQKLMRKKLHLMLASLFLVTLCIYSPLYGQKSVNIGKTATAPVLDGVVEALWDDAPAYIAVDPHSWCYDGWIAGWFGREVSMQSDEDFSMNWKAVWDDTNLYFLITFTDDVVTTGDVANMGASEKLWMMDCAEVKIGDYFYRFGYNRDDEIFQRPSEGQFNPGGYTQKSALVTGGYIIEVQIPWSTLNNDSVTIGLDPDVDTEFMLWVSGADLDNPAGKAWNDQDGHIHWPIDNGKEKVVLAATAAIDNTPPAVPQNLASSDVTAKDAKLSWETVPDADLRGYVVMDGDIRIKYVLDTVTDNTVTLAKETDYSFRVKANDGQNLSGASNAVIISTKIPPPDIFIGMTDDAISIDGVRESAWGAAPQYVAVDPTTWTPNPDHQSLADCSFKWSALWDEDSLYVFVSVMDDIPTTGDFEAEGSSAKSWMNDNVELSIAPIDGEGNPWFFRFGYNREPLDLGLLDPEPKNTPVGSRYATADQTGGWVMEAAIPWKILSIDPGSFTGWADIDKKFNVGIYVADLDDPAATSWDKLSGHVQWPKGWSTADVTLAETVAIDPVAPAAPKGVTASDITLTGATLSWTASPEADVAGYLVLKGEAPFIYTAETSVELSGLSAQTEYTFTIHAVDPQNISAGSKSVAFSTLAPPPLKSIYIPRYAGSFANTFDDLDYWEILTPNNLEYGTFIPDDFTTSFKAAWDMNNLYMQIATVDPPPVVNGKTNPWENDNTEVHFDLQNAKDGTSCEDVDGDKYQKDNMQYRFIAHEPSRQHGSTPAPNWTNITQVYWDLYDASGTTIIGWYVEVTFPWSTLNLTADGFFTFVPAEGNKIGLELHAFDYDTDESSDQGYWSSYEQLPPNRNNAQYGEFILGGTSSVRNPESQLIRIYPNPADREFRLDVPGEGYTLTITDLAGQAVVSATSLSMGLQQIDISNLSSGVYMISLQNGNEFYRSKLIKN